MMRGSSPPRNAQRGSSPEATLASVRDERSRPRHEDADRRDALHQDVRRISLDWPTEQIEGMRPQWKARIIPENIDRALDSHLRPPAPPPEVCKQGTSFVERNLLGPLVGHLGYRTKWLFAAGHVGLNML
jgi:hypothetical protein